jgi:dihydrofolate reductase
MDDSIKATTINERITLQEIRSRVTINMIAAVSEDGIIGIDNKIPWHLPEDLKNFKQMTTGRPVIMGKNTFLSIGKPLPERTNIVISTTLEPSDGYLIAKDPMDAIELAYQNLHQFNHVICIIGGEKIYNEFFPFTDRITLTRVQTDAARLGVDIEKCAKFPLDAIDYYGFKRISQSRHAFLEGEGPNFIIEEYTRKK